MINLEISNYDGVYSKLNGQKKQIVKPLDLARAIVTVGQSSWSDVFDLGVFRIAELICKSLAFTKSEKGNLVLCDKFYNLNQSEKVTISYYFGQGLTKLYSEEYLKVKWLFHVDDCVNCIEFYKKGTVMPKVTVGKTKKNASRPDLIGIERKNESHILEAKGNSGGYDKSVMQHAINQVSQIKTYNSVLPRTRTACYFDLSTNPINGIIIDPENNDYGIDIKFNEELALEKYYSFFVENRSNFSGLKIGNFTYMIMPVGVPSIYFGFDSRILEMTPSELLSEGLYNDNLEIMRQDGELSIGPDGIILINKRYLS